MRCSVWSQTFHVGEKTARSTGKMKHRHTHSWQWLLLFWCRERRCHLERCIHSLRPGPSWCQWCWDIRHCRTSWLEWKKEETNGFHTVGTNNTQANTTDRIYVSFTRPILCIRKKYHLTLCFSRCRPTIALCTKHTIDFSPISGSIIRVIFTRRQEMK